MVTAEAIIGQGHTRTRVHGFYVNQCNVLNLYVMCSNVLNLYVVKTIIHCSGPFLFNHPSTVIHRLRIQHRHIAIDVLVLLPDTAT